MNDEWDRHKMVHICGIIFHGKKDIPIFSIYCPPKSDPNDIFQFINKYDHETIVVGGDINISHNIWSNNDLNNIKPNAITFADNINEFEYNINNNGNMTHFNHNTNDTAIDITFNKINKNIKINK